MDIEKFTHFPYQHFDFQLFQGAAGTGPYMSLLTEEQKQRGSSFNYYYGSQIFPSKIINEELSSRSISPEPTSSIADTSAGPTIWLTFLASKIRCVTSQCNCIYQKILEQKFATPKFFLNFRQAYKIFVTYMYSVVLPASRGPFPGDRWQEKRDLCHGSKMATLSMLPSLAHITHNVC